MISFIPDLPDNCLGISLAGTLTSDDYEDALIPAMDGMLARGKGRLLCVIAETFEGADAGALWDDTKYGLSHFFDFERVAIVTDHTTYGRLAHLFGFMIPAKVKIFPMEQIANAKAWIIAS
ncbi:STAS/SEC14 domain-containing protein [Martelella sp. HB161492]|uniref:STAS/SEC14 domain-containing protein n=1 Tax=Martelella sp. HB161492 TaxID=2720726 RepID=UPI001591B4A5|nr:STAS/SEC14 domain-containing protein [Martelella sp. HB161492]